MPKVIIICDQNFLKNITDIERVLQNYGGFQSEEAKQIALLCAGDKPVSINVESSEQAKDLIENLRKIMFVEAKVEDL